MILGIIQRVKAAWHSYMKYLDSICPNCGPYCTDKMVFCCPPIKKEPES